MKLLNRAIETAQRLDKNPAASPSCVLRDALRLRRSAPQHDGMLFDGIEEERHPEDRVAGISKDARHQSILFDYRCPASQRIPQ